MKALGELKARETPAFARPGPPTDRPPRYGHAVPAGSIAAPTTPTAPGSRDRALAGTGIAALTLGALGVVFGDIGTSPLYALQAVFTSNHHAVKATQAEVYGVISLVFWTITMVVTVKYLSTVMRADDRGQGGIMALTALLQAARRSRSAIVPMALIILGIIGASLFYGDGAITPAISVLSAVEGLKIAIPSLASLVLPIAVAVLCVLFAVQRFGTGVVGNLFGPVMVVWFSVLGVGRSRRGRPSPRRPARPLAQLRGPVLRRTRRRGVPRARLGRAGRHRRRGALRGHGSLRSPSDSPRLVPGGLPRAHAQLPGAGGAARALRRGPYRTRSTCSCPPGGAFRWSSWRPPPRSSPRRP